MQWVRSLYIPTSIILCESSELVSVYTYKVEHVASVGGREADSYAALHQSGGREPNHHHRYLPPQHLVRELPVCVCANYTTNGLKSEIYQDLDNVCEVIPKGFRAALHIPVCYLLGRREAHEIIYLIYAVC